MAPVLSIIFVWIILHYFKPTLCPQEAWFEKYAFLFNYQLSRFIKNQKINQVIIILIPICLFGIVFYVLKMKHLYIISFILSTVVLWYGCIYQLKVEVLPSALQAQEEEIFAKPLTRSFTVILWFLLLGPLGVLLYDFLRRLDFFPLNNLLEWPAARVLGFGYGLAGHFPPVFSYWSHHLFSDVSENQQYIKNCGYLALYGSLDSHSVNDQSLLQAKALVRRAKMMLFIVVVIFSIGVML